MYRDTGPRLIKLATISTQVRLQQVLRSGCMNEIYLIGRSIISFIPTYPVTLNRCDIRQFGKWLDHHMSEVTLKCLRLSIESSTRSHATLRVLKCNSIAGDNLASKSRFSLDHPSAVNFDDLLLNLWFLMFHISTKYKNLNFQLIYLIITEPANPNANSVKRWEV